MFATDVGVCEVGKTLTKITPHGKIVYRVCKGVELTDETIEDFCRDAVNPQECEVAAVAGGDVSAFASDSVCDVGKIITLFKITPHGKVVYRVCKGVELTYETIEYFCQNAVNPQECETAAGTVAAGTAAGIAIASAGIATGAATATATAAVSGSSVVAAVVGGTLATPVIIPAVAITATTVAISGAVYWWFSD